MLKLFLPECNIPGFNYELGRSNQPMYPTPGAGGPGSLTCFARSARTIVVRWTDLRNRMLPW